jgi:putative zinc finger protein
VSAHVLDRLSLYLDGELAAAARTEVEAHLRGCSACARHLEELAAVDTAARELPVPAPAGYFDSLPARVRARLSVPRRRTAPVWVWAAAAGVALAALTPLLFRQTASPVPAMRTEETARVAAPPPTIAAVEPVEAVPEGGERAKTRAALKDAGQWKPGPTPAPLLYKKAQENAAAARPSTTGQIQKHNGPFAQAPAAAPPPQAPTPALASQPAARVDEARAGEPPEEAPARAAKEVQREAAPEGKLERDQDRRGGLTDSIELAQAPGEEARYRGLLARQPASADAARKLHDDWAAFAKAHAEGPRADEARVRALDALLSAYRRGGAARDRQRLREEAALYLQRSDAAQAPRVRALLEAASLQ